MTANPKLQFLADTVLAEAEHLGWIESVETWIIRLRNRMIHEYVRDPAELASTLMVGHAAVPLLANAATAMASRVMVDPSDPKGR